MKLGRIPTRPLKSLLSRRSDRYTIYHEDRDDDSWNDGPSSLADSGERVAMDVYGHQSNRESYPTGEVTDASLNGLMDADEYVDALDDGDLIVHGGDVFEVTYNPYPDATTTIVYTLTLDERTDITAP